MSSYFNKMSVVSLSTALILAVSGCGSGSSSTTPAVVDSVLSGSAALSGTLGSNTTPSLDPDASAQLIVDLNRNGTYGDSKDITYNSQVVDGTFNFSGMKIEKEGITKAQLTVLKRGFAPVVKIVTLSNGQTLSIRTEAGTTPVQTEVVSIDRNDSSINLQGAFLKVGLRTTTLGVQSYSKIMSLSQLRAESEDPSSSEGDISTSVISLDALPSDVTEIRADMRAFDPTNEEDSKYFPGEYKGSKPSDAQATNEERELVSVGFDLISLTDQNGEDVVFDTSVLKESKLRPQLIDYSSCLQTKVRYLGDTQVALIEDMMIETNSTEIPMWYYDYESGIWNYLGEAEYTDAASSSNGRAYATMCVKENWGKYLNLDYDFAIEQPKNVCVKATDQDGNAVTNLNLSAKKGSAYSNAYLDANGEANLALSFGGDATEYTFTYSGALTSWVTLNIDEFVVENSPKVGDCDYNLSIVIQNPYTTTLEVNATNKEGNADTDGYVYVQNSGGNYFYEYAYLDENGQATFKIAPDVNYVVHYNAQTATVKANGITDNNESSDTGTKVTVSIVEQNQAPDVYAYFYNPVISDKATQAKFYVSATDPNGDAITLDSLVFNETALVKGTHYEVTQQYTGNGYDSFYAILDLEHEDIKDKVSLKSLVADNIYSLVVTYSDGEPKTTEASTSLHVEANRAPVINGINLYSNAEGYVNVNAEVLAGDYTISAYAYDPNGDEIVKTYKLNDGNFTQSNSVSLENGNTYTITVKVTEVGSDALSAEESFSVTVGDRSPVVDPFTALTYDNEVINGNLIETTPDPVNVNIIGESPIGLTLYITGAYTFDGAAYNDLAAGETRDVVANVRVTNAYGSADTNFTVTVTGTNDAPTLTLPVSVTTSAAGVDIPYTASDVDGVVTVSATAINGTVSVGDTNLTYTPNIDALSDTITVVATDGDLNVTKTVTVFFGNQPPVFPDQQEFFVEGGAAISGNIDFTDDGETPATIAVTGTSPAGFTLNPDGSFTYSAAAFAELTLGSQEHLEVAVTVTDSEGLSTSGMVFIVVEGVYEYFEAGGFTEGMSIYGVEADDEYGVHAWVNVLGSDGTITETGWYLDSNSGEFVLDTTTQEDGEELLLIDGVWTQGWGEDSYELVNGNIRFANGGMIAILRTIDLVNPSDTDAEAIAAISAQIPGNPTIEFSRGAEAYEIGFQSPEMYILTYQPKLQVQDPVTFEWTPTDTPFSTILDYMGSVNSPVGSYDPTTGEWIGIDFERFTSGEAAYFHEYPVVDSTGDPIGSLSEGMTGSLVTFESINSSYTQTVVGSWRVVTLPDGAGLAIELAPTEGNEALFGIYPNTLIAVANGTVYQGAHIAASTEFVVDEEGAAGLNEIAFNDVKAAILAYYAEPTTDSLSSFLAGQTLWSQVSGESGTLERQTFNSNATGATWTEIVSNDAELCTGTVSLVFETNSTVTVVGLTDSCSSEDIGIPFNVSIEANEAWNYILVDGDKWYFNEADAREDFLGETASSASDAALVNLFVGKTVYYIEVADDGSTSGASITFDAGTVSESGVYSGYFGGIDSNGGYGISATPPDQTHSYVIDGDTIHATEVQNGDNPGEISDISISKEMSNNGTELVVASYTIDRAFKGVSTFVVYPTEADRDAAMSIYFDLGAYFDGTKYSVDENGVLGFRVFDTSTNTYSGVVDNVDVSGAFGAISETVMSFARVTPSYAGMELTHVGPTDFGNGETFSLVFDGEPAIEVYYFDTEQERTDAIAAANAAP